MSLVTFVDPATRCEAPEIAVEASSAIAWEPDDEELWGRPFRRRPDVSPRSGRWRKALTAVAVLVMAVGAIRLRTPIVRAAPVMAVAYEAVGLPVNLPGLALRDVRARIVRDGDRRVLVTEGEIVNIRRAENRVPALSLSVRGANGLQRYAWTAPAPKTRLEAGEAVTFRARLAAPPEDGAEVVVRFASSAPSAFRDDVILDLPKLRGGGLHDRR
jgi:hypothetical protein